MELSVIKRNRRALAVFLILFFVTSSAIMLKFKQITDRLGHLESTVNSQAHELNQLRDSHSDQESEIESLKSDVDDLKSQR